MLFRTTGFSVIFDEKHTGQDFDAAGKPEVVFITDTRGGNHCCWAYNVISLSPKPHKLFDIDAPGAVRFEKDNQGKVVIWQRTAGPYGFASMAGPPFAEKVLRIREGKLVDATPEFCSRIFSDENEDYRAWSRVLPQENIKKLQSTGSTGVGTEEIVGDLLSRACNASSAISSMQPSTISTIATVFTHFRDARLWGSLLIGRLPKRVHCGKFILLSKSWNRGSDWSTSNSRMQRISRSA